MIPESFIQELLERVDVADVVGRYVQLRKGGANLLGLCPFHQEKSPSFTVSPSKQFYHCFGCGAHGTAIRFLMEYQGASFPEAVRQLADSVGLVVPSEPGTGSPAARQQRAERQAEQSRHTQVLEAANTWYRKELRSAAAAIEYLKSRGLSGQIAARYGLGWAPASRRGLAEVFPSYDEPQFAAFLIECGLLIESDDGRRYDRFRSRVMFPIRNARGHLIGFGGRLVGPGEPKYLNSPETPVFSKGNELYGLWEARQEIRLAGQVVVVEGYMDVVALAQMGIGNAVATLGTATTPTHIQKLLRASSQVVFSFDGDRAGRKAAWRALQASLPLLRDDVALRFLFLPPEHDPDSYVRAHGAEAFREALKGAQPLSVLLFEELEREHDLQHAEGRAHCLREATPLLQAIPACGLRMQLVRELAQRVRLTPEEITPQLQLQEEPSGPLVHGSRLAPRLMASAAPAAANGPTKAPGETASAAADSGGEPPMWDVPPEFDGGGYEPAYDVDDDGGYSGDWQAPSESSSPRRSGGKRGDSGSYSGAGGGARSGKKKFWRKGEQDDAPRRRERRVGVMAIPARLLRLLLAHPQLVAEVEAQEWDCLRGERNFELVWQLLEQLREHPASQTAGLLQALSGTPLEQELLEATSDLLLMDDLPDPQAELQDTLRSILLQRLQREQAALIERAGNDPEALRRFAELGKEIARLRQAV